MSENNATPEDNATGSMETEPQMLRDSSPQAREFDSVPGQDSSPVMPDRSCTEFVPLVAELDEALNRLHGKMHGLDAALRESDARALMLEEQGQVINGLQDTAQHSREQLEEKQHAISLLAEKIEKKDQQIAGLHAAAEAREQEVAGLFERAEEHRQEITRLTGEAEQQTQTISGLQGNIGDLNASLRASRADTEQQLEQKQQEISRLSGTLDENAQQLAGLHAQVSEKQQTIAGLEESLRQANLALRVNEEHAAHQLDSKQQEMAQLELSVKEKNTEISELHGTIHDLSVELQASREQAAQALELKSPEINRLEARVRELDTALHASQEHAARQLEENTQLLAGKEQAISVLTAQQEETLRAMASSSDEKLEEQGRLISQLTVQLEERVQEITRLHGKIHTMGVEQDASEARISQQLKENAREVSQLESQLKARETAPNDTSGSAAQPVEEQLQIISQLQAQLAAREQEAASMQDKIRSMEADVVAAGKYDRQLADQGQQVDQLQEKIRQLEAVAEQQTDQDALLADLNEELEEKGNMVTRLQAQLNSLQHTANTEAAGQQQGEELARLQREVRELQASLSAAEAHATRPAASVQQAAAQSGPADNAEAAASNALFQERLKKLSTLDLLTGMANRQYFMQLLEQAGSGEQALLYILLDDFRAIRENLGVTDSDMLLRDVAGIIQENIGAQDSVARFGDFVFTVIHRGDARHTTRDFAEGILHSLESHVFNKAGHAVQVAASIGICETGSHNLNAEALIQRADLACEVARSSGDGKIHFHNVDLEQQLRPEHGTAMQEMVRKTIQASRFYLVYQPIISLGGDKRERYEVLLRVLDEAGEVILPSQFLEVAGSMGMGSEVDRWVIDNALRQLSELQRDGKDVTFYIKVTADTMVDAELPAWIDAKLTEYPLQRENVVFEIAETAVVDDVQGAVAFIAALHNLKCRVALEHYGCSSQPQLLKRLPVDILKVNGSLISGLMANQQNQVRVKAIIELARNLDMQCVAERVEETSDLALLWQFGVQFVQGNFVQIPSKQLGYNFEGDIAAEKPTLFSQGIG